MIDPKYLRKDGGIKNLGVPPEIKTQWFIEKAKEVHGELYDYSEQVYTKSIQKLDIICPKHGIFQQSPNNHLKHKQGCPTCAREASQLRYQDTKEDFIAKQREIHGDTYSYDQVSYTNCMTKVSILCQIHGEFTQTPDNHLRGRQGCPYCKGKTADTVYVLKCLDTGLVKIGITKDLVRRSKEVGNTRVIQQVKHVSPRDLETTLHTKYSQFRVTNYKALSGNTEFFQLDNDMLLQLREDILRQVII